MTMTVGRTLPRMPTLSVSIVRTIVEAVEDAGVSAAEFLGASGIDPELLRHAEARLSGKDVYCLCARAVDVTGDEAFGLRWAERLRGSALGPLAHLIAHAGTLRQGLASLDKFARLLTDHTCHELLEHGDIAQVRCTMLPGPPRMQRIFAEHMMAFFFRLLRDFDRHALLHLVSFQHPSPVDRGPYDRVFDGRARFDQPFTGVVFERALLDRPAPHKDDDVHDALKDLAERRLVRIAQPSSYVLRVRDALAKQTFPARSDMETVARALGMSVRSLRRRLVEEGKSYNEVANETMALLAKRLLREEHRTIQETAYELGFSDAHAFYRAFKRWTGETPGGYRGDARRK